MVDETSKASGTPAQLAEPAPMPSESFNKVEESRALNKRGLEQIDQLAKRQIESPLNVPIEVQWIASAINRTRLHAPVGDVADAEAARRRREQIVSASQRLVEALLSHDSSRGLRAMRFGVRPELVEPKAAKVFEKSVIEGLASVARLGAGQGAAPSEVAAKKPVERLPPFGAERGSIEEVPPAAVKSARPEADVEPSRVGPVDPDETVGVAAAAGESVDLSPAISGQEPQARAGAPASAPRTEEADRGHSQEHQQALLAKARSLIAEWQGSIPQELLGQAMAQLAQALKQAGATEETIERVRSEAQPSVEDDEELASADWENVVLRTAMRLRSAAGNPVRILNIVTGRLAAAVRGLEAQGDVFTPERQADLMIHLFAGEPVYAGSDSRRPRLTEEFMQVLTHLRDRLWLAHASAGELPGVSPGVLETFTNLVTWMAHGLTTNRRPSLLWSCDLALPLMKAYLQADSQFALVDRMSRQVANNLSGWLGDLLDAKDEERISAELGKKLNTMHALATVCYLRSGSFGSRSEEASALFQSFGSELSLPQPEHAARALRFMANIPSAWRFVGPAFDELAAWRDAEVPEGAPKVRHIVSRAPRLTTAVLAALAATVRAQLNALSDADEASSALFNLGVDANLMRRSFGAMRNAASLRLLANGFGLWWALFRGRNLRHAMLELHGADCAVNLFGALGDEEMADFVALRSNNQLLEPLARELLGVFADLKLESNQGRLTGAYKRLFGEDFTGRRPGTPHGQSTLGELQWSSTVLEMLRRHVKAVEPATVLDSLSQDAMEAGFPQVMAQWLRWAFQQLTFELDKEPVSFRDHFDEVRDYWLRVAAVAVERAADDVRPDSNRFFTEHLGFTLAAWGVEDHVVPHPVRQAKASQRPVSELLADRALMNGMLVTGKLVQASPIKSLSSGTGP